MADRPQVRARGFHVRSRARASSVWAPRFEASSSCHSSTTTHRRSANSSRPSSRVRNRLKLSGRRDEDRRQPLPLAVADRGLRVGRAGLDRPVEAEAVAGVLQGKRPCPPQGPAGALSTGPGAVVFLSVAPSAMASSSGAEERGERLTGAGRGVDQPAFAGGVRGPDLALERESAPTAVGEPLLRGRHSALGRSGVRPHGCRARRPVDGSYRALRQQLLDRFQRVRLLGLLVRPPAEHAREADGDPALVPRSTPGCPRSPARRPAPASPSAPGRTSPACSRRTNASTCGSPRRSGRSTPWRTAPACRRPRRRTCSR